MKLLGKTLREYGEYFIAYRYYLGQGEMIIGEIEQLVASGGIAAVLLLVIERYSGWLPPWQWAVAIGLGMRVLKVLAGIADRKWLKLGQMSTEWGYKKKVNTFSVAQMERLKNIEKKVAPETYCEHDRGYVKEENLDK